MILTLATLLIASTVSRPAVFNKYPCYDIETTRFAITYQPGGRTVKQAWGKVGEYTPDEKVIAVFNGGYFDPAANPIAAVDLVVSKGVELVPYRFDLSRPILAFGNGRVAIFTGKNGEAYAKYLQYRRVGGYINAIAVDSKPIQPKSKKARRIIGRRGHELVNMPIPDANLRDCQREIAEQQLDQWIYLDGGSSVFNWVKVPTHIVVLVPKNDLDG